MIQSGLGSSSRRSHNMTTSRHRLTLIDLLATVAAAALGMGFLVWVAPPPQGVPAPIIIFWLIVPLVGILWDRWRGCTGILGGVLGGAAEAGFSLIWVITGPHMPGQMGPSYLAKYPVEVAFIIAGFLTFGTLMRVATWLVAAAMGTVRSPAVPSPNDRFVRQR
jgi:hypothetical protein